MNSESYKDIFKRKSFHLFRNIGTEFIAQPELENMEAAYHSFDRLYPEIRTAIRILPADKVNFTRGAEYCVLLYSEKKDNYLMNIGYIGEQLDLYLVHHNIGTLWYGIGKPDIQSYEGLDYVIMLAVCKVSDLSKYRKDMFKANRKPLEAIWEGDTLGIAEVARFAPSACNTQPWCVKSDGNVLTVYRYKNAGKRGIMPVSAVTYYNRIDIGIFLCILEICMAERGIPSDRVLYADDADAEYTKVAEYAIHLDKKERC